MSIQALSLTTCPFCEDDNGEININATKLVSWQATFPEGGKILIHDQPDQEILNFNSESSDPGPCQHALQFYAAICRGEEHPQGGIRHDWCLELDWWVPAFDDTDVGRVLCSYLHEVALDRRGPRKFLPKAPLYEARFGRRWRDTSQPADEASFFRIQGNIVFAEDVAAYVAEVPQLAADREAWFKEHFPHAVECLNVGYEEIDMKNSSRTVPKRPQRQCPTSSAPVVSSRCGG